MNVVGFLAETMQRLIVRILSVVVLIAFADISQSVPPNYCFLPLNTTDCKGPPTPVFYYYKPGSRCEIGVWRGCPTQNKFPDEVLCVHTCIAKFIAQADSRENQVLAIKTVTTPKDEVNKLSDWENQLNQMTLDEADDLVIILDEILEQKPKPKRTKLKDTMATIKTTSGEATTATELISEIDSSTIEDMPTTGTDFENTTLAETTPTDSTIEDNTTADSTKGDTTLTDSTTEDTTITDSTTEDTTITDSTTDDTTITDSTTEYTTTEETTATTTSATTPSTTLAASTTPSSTSTTAATTFSEGDADEVILIH